MLCPTLVHHYLTLSAGRFPDKVALVCGAERLTYGSIDHRADLLAQAIRGLGLRRQDRVVVFLDTCVESVLSLYGILKADCVFVVINGTMKARKLRYILEDSGARLLITHVSKAEVVEQAFADPGADCRILWVGDANQIPPGLTSSSFQWSTALSGEGGRGDPETRKAVPARQACIDQDLAALIYTSGSTGDPKGVMSSHRNILAAAQSIIAYLDNTEHDVILNVLPLSFDYGLYQVLMTFMFGGTVVLEGSFLHLHSVLERVPAEGVTGFPIVPTIAAMLLRMQDLTRYQLRSLRYVTSTGAPLPAEHIRRLRELMPRTKLFSMYGLTECKRVSYLPPEEVDRRPGSVGKAIPNCEVRVVDGDGQEVKPGQVGELVVRGANVTRGYWNDPEQTAKTFREGLYPAEQVLHTGDLFQRDEDGFLYFVGRKDDMIKVGAERVSPKEIESVICEMEGVSEAAVIGVPDEILGQAVKAYVVPAPNTSLKEKEVSRFCAERLEQRMIPKYVECVCQLPRTLHGKVDKRAQRKAEDC